MMPWLARFEGGPCEGSPDRLFTGVDEPWREMRLANLGPPQGWALVGGDGIDPGGGDAAPPPFPDSVLYTLVRVELGEIQWGVQGQIAYYSPAP
jgi:hypothetical protein